MPILSFHRSDRLHEYYDLDRDVTVVGRGGGCDIVLGDPSVSREHALIVRGDTGYTIEDAGSKNGIRLNGRVVSSAPLIAGNQIMFGDVAARFLDSPDQAAGGAEETRFVSREDMEASPAPVRLFYDLAEAAASACDGKEIVDVTLAIVGRQLRCEHAYLGLLDDGGSEIAREHALTFNDATDSPLALPKSLLRQVIERRSGAMIGAQGGKARSALAVPMTVGGTPTGILYAVAGDGEPSLNRDDLVFLSALGSLSAASIHHIRSIRTLEESNRALRDQLEPLRLIGDSDSIETVRDTIRRAATIGDAPVLITGESGTGKELAARTIHRLSDRAEGPFVDVNCAAIPPDLIESELFGHVRGAFTSASQDRRGVFELADGGTLFLDEIGEMSPDLQSKLLRVLETGEFRRIGGETPRRSNVRIIAATNRDPESLTKDVGFRQDLFYRLNVLPIHMPRLRDHSEDIPALVDHFLASARLRVSTKVSRFSDNSIMTLKRHSWPGNVRELKNLVERTLYFCDREEVQSEDLHLSVADESVESDDVVADSGGTLAEDVSRLETARIRAALERHHWNKSHVARELGITRKTLAAKLKKYDLE